MEVVGSKENEIYEILAEKFAEVLIPQGFDLLKKRNHNRKCDNWLACSFTAPNELINPDPSLTNIHNIMII